MRHSSYVRLGIIACGSLALWMLSASAAAAAPTPRRHACITRLPCGARLPPRPVRARAGDDDSPRHSVHYLLKTHRLLSRQLRTWLERRRTDPLHEGDAAALQNATAALGGEDDLLVMASLEPLGVLVPPPCRITFRLAVTPRSPRGPPLSAAVA